MERGRQVLQFSNFTAKFVFILRNRNKKSQKIVSNNEKNIQFFKMTEVMFILSVRSAEKMKLKLLIIDHVYKKITDFLTVKFC